MLERLLNDLGYLLRIGHVEGQWQNRLSEAILKICDVFQLARCCGDFVSTLKRGLGQMRPKPREAPVINQTLLLIPFLPLRIRAL